MLQCYISQYFLKNHWYSLTKIQGECYKFYNMGILLFESIIYDVCKSVCIRENWRKNIKYLQYHFSDIFVFKLCLRCFDSMLWGSYQSRNLSTARSHCSMVFTILSCRCKFGRNVSFVLCTECNSSLELHIPYKSRIGLLSCI